MRDVMLILHFIGLAMGLGTAFAHAFIGFQAIKSTNNEAIDLNSKALSQMGTVGLVLLIISGIYLIIPYWNALPFMPMLTLKLILVGVLILLLSMIHFYSRKALVNGANKSKTVAILGKISLTTTLLILILAVLVFH